VVSIISLSQNYRKGDLTMDIEAVTTAVDKVQTDALAILAVVVPVILALAAALIGIRVGMKFFKKVGS
jgi:hypothetical protein